VDALEDALYRLLTDDLLAKQCRENLEAAVDDFRWERAVRPLIEFCRKGKRAADAVTIAPPIMPLGDVPPAAAAALRRGVMQDLAVTRELMRQGGARLVAKRAVGRVRRVLRTH